MKQIYTITTANGTRQISSVFWLYFIRDVLEYTCESEGQGYALFNQLPNYIKRAMIQKELIPKFKIKYISDYDFQLCLKQREQWLLNFHTDSQKCVYVQNWGMYMIYSYNADSFRILFKYVQTDNGVRPVIQAILCSLTGNFVFLYKNGRLCKIVIEQKYADYKQKSCQCERGCCKYHEEIDSEPESDSEYEIDDVVIQVGKRYIKEITLDPLYMKKWNMKQTKTHIELSLNYLKVTLKHTPMGIIVDTLKDSEFVFYNSANPFSLNTTQLKSRYSSDKCFRMDQPLRSDDPIYQSHLNLDPPEFCIKGTSDRGLRSIQTCQQMLNVIQQYSYDYTSDFHSPIQCALYDLALSYKKGQEQSTITISREQLEDLYDQYCNPLTRATCFVQATIYCQLLLMKINGDSEITLTLQTALLRHLCSIQSLGQLRVYMSDRLSKRRVQFCYQQDTPYDLSPLYDILL